MLDDDTRTARRRLVAGLQQQAMPADTRQQQQDNGTREFQASSQQGGWLQPARRSLESYLQAAGRRGELPAQRPSLRLASPTSQPG